MLFMLGGTELHKIDIFSMFRFDKDTKRQQILNLA